MNLFQPNATYIAEIEGGLHYLNCPKHMFNETLHQLVRGQGHLAVLSFLLGIHYPQAHKAAQTAMDTFIHVSPSKLQANNPNIYADLPIEALPVQCQRTHARLSKKFEEVKPKFTWWDWAIGKTYDSAIHQ